MVIVDLRKRYRKEVSVTLTLAKNVEQHINRRTLSRKRPAIDPVVPVAFNDKCDFY